MIKNTAAPNDDEKRFNKTLKRMVKTLPKLQAPFLRERGKNGVGWHEVMESADQDEVLED